MEKIDFKRRLKPLYQASAKEIVQVDVPAFADVRGGRRGKHHEIYLSDIRRSPPMENHHPPAYAMKVNHLDREAALHFEWQYSLDDVDWEALSDLYRLAPLGDKKPADLKLAFANSLFKCFVFDAEKLIGAGRALADGIDCSYICDVAILPAYQGRGIGKAIVAGLVERSQGHRKILLYAAPGKEPFYRQLGFKRMSTAMAIFQNQSQALEWGLVNDE